MVLMTVLACCGVIGGVTARLLRPGDKDTLAPIADVSLSVQEPYETQASAVLTAMKIPLRWI